MSKFNGRVSSVETANEAGMSIVHVRAHEGTVATFRTTTRTQSDHFMPGDAVFMDPDAQLVQSARPLGIGVTINNAVWKEPPTFLQAVPVQGLRIGNEELKGRVVAVQSTSAGYRVMARFGLASGGCLEAELDLDWEPMPGERCHVSGSDDRVRFSDDPGEPLGNRADWAEAEYRIAAPMIDDSGPHPDVRVLLEDSGGRLERVDDPVRGRVWIAFVGTKRGEAHHVKFPQETWEQVCRNIGVDWPGVAQRWDENGPIINGGDLWSISPQYEEAMTRVIDDCRRGVGEVEEFLVPCQVGFNGLYRGVAVRTDASLPDGTLIFTACATSSGRTVSRIEGLVS